MKKLERQTILLLLCALGIAGSWIFIQVANESRGAWTESSGLQFTTPDLLGLGPRSELHCAGAVVGHVRQIESGIAANGSPIFTIVAGVRREFATWRFAKIGKVQLGVVQSALSPSSINLKLATAEQVAAKDFAQPGSLRHGKPPVLKLEPEDSNNDLSDVAEQYRKIGERIDKAISQFTEPQNGRTESVMQELAEAIPSAASSVRQINEATASISGESHSLPGTDPAKRPPIDRLLGKLDATTDNLESVTEDLKKTAGKDGKLDNTLDTLEGDLRQIKEVTDRTTKTITSLNLEIDASLRKVNGLVDETTATMTALHDKVERIGDTFFGRMLIATPKKKATPSPTPARSARESR